MATGDLLSAVILADAITLELTFEGMSTGGTYSTRMGFGTNNDPFDTTNPRCTVSTVGFGFDPSGNSITVPRALRACFTYLTLPANTTPYETQSGSNVIVRVTLEDMVYSKENTGAGNSGTAPTVTISAGFYTSGGTPNNAATNFPVTNNSTAGYQVTIGNWTMQPYQRFTGSTARLSCVAFNRHPQNGRPVQFVRFSLTDGTNTVTKDVYEMDIDRSRPYPDALPTAEYFADLSLATLTQGAVLTAKFQAFPFIGDTTSIRDSSTTGATEPTPLLAPHPHLCDKNGTYGVTMALVNSSTGNDTTGQAYDSASYNAGTALPFATIGKAAKAIETYNNTNRARNDVGGGIIELAAGNHAWLGSVNTFVGTPATWLTIRPAPGVSRYGAAIASGSQAGISHRVLFQSITFTATVANLLTNINAICCIDCNMNSTSAGMFNTTGGVGWWIGGSVTAFTQGFRPASTANCTWALVRGVDLGSFTGTILCYTVMGCKKSGLVTPVGKLFITEYAGMGAPNPSVMGNSIIYNCSATGLSTTGTVMMDTGNVYPNQYGAAIIQVLLETNGGPGSNGLADICSSDPAGGANTPLRNILLWNNTWVGSRCFIGYNDSSTPSIFKDRYYWSVLNNYADRWATKGAEHPTADPVRIGNQTQYYGVGYAGNHFEMCMFSGASFYFKFAGKSSFQPAPGNTGTSANPRFTNRKSATEVAGVIVAGTGDGDYTVGPDSPLINRSLISPIPFDMLGRKRGARDCAGVFSLRKSTLGRTLA